MLSLYCVEVVAMWLCSKGSKEQKRGRMSLVQTLQMPTEKNQEEDREGIVQLRIYRVQASFVSMKI
jgi:hypothetical protein